MKLKLIISAALAFSALLVTTAIAADNKSFTDVDFSSEQGQAIEKMYNAGYLAGYNDGSFKPDATITRAELTRVFNQVFEYELNEEKAANMADFFDVEKEAWYYNDVKIAQSNGYINGFNDNTFRPQNNFTREQTCVVLALAANLNSVANDITINDKVSPWAETYVKSAIADGAFKLENNNNFRATVNITRGEVCQALAKYVNVKDNVINETSTEATSNSVTTSNTETTTNYRNETTTSKTNTSSNGSSGSSGSSGVDNKTTTTEATTETTTKSSKPTTSTTTTTEFTTEPTTESVITLNDDQMKALNNVISDTEDILIYKLKTQNEVDVANYILNAMISYRDDNTFDITSAVSEAKNMYYSLSSAERDDFKNCISISYNLSDVGKLREVFSAFF